MAAAHGGVEYFEIEGGLGRVETAQFGATVSFIAAVALERVGPGLEGGAAFSQQRVEGALDDEVDERLGRVEAAAVLAGVAVGADDDVAGGVAGRFALEQALVDGAKLLDGHVAVVDEAAAGAALGVAEVVDDRGEDGVGQADALEQGRGLLGEKAAVVGRQADGGVALVDLAAECSDLVVVAACEVGEGVAVFGALGDVVAHGLAQAVVVVAAVVDGQQVAVLGVEEEEEAVEEDERGLAHVFQFGATFAGEGANQGGIDAFEDDAGEVLRDLLFVAAAFGEGVFEEACLRALLRAEGGTSEEQAEGAQAVFVLRVDERFKIDFVVAAGAGAGAAVVESPDAAVGEDAPADAAVRADVGGGEIAQELGMGRAGAAAIVVVACVEGESEAFAFGDGERVGVALGGEFGGGGA